MKKIFLYQGIILLTISLFMFLCHICNIIYNTESMTMLNSVKTVIIIALFFLIIDRLLSRYINHNKSEYFNTLILFILWFSTSIFCAIPFYYEGYSIYDSIFESVSGITTTGASIIIDIEKQTKGILLWRMILHLIGGVGIVIYASVMLPIFTNKDMESVIKSYNPSNIEERLFSKNSQFYKAIAVIYLSLIIICGFLYYIFGMNIFDSICHSISTISTGGFFNYNNSFAYYDNFFIELVAEIFMLLSSIPFIILIRYLLTTEYISDEQTKTYLIQTFIAIIIVCSILIIRKEYPTTAENLRYGIFNTISMATTSGFSNGEYYFWHYLTHILILIAVIGGCSGSTAGGLKIFRIYIIFKSIYQSILESLSEKIFHPVRYLNKTIDRKIITMITIFVIINIITTISIMVIMSLYNYNFVTSSTTAISILNNIGAVFGDAAIEQNFQFLNNNAKLFLSLIMIIGRMEILPILTMIICFMKKKRYKIIN
ncbi:TrkH family potassium uptake protein [Anaplasmataceae bacterium AB001_6]|nr:TrkH family potassium uptake protein [Anaplasmataceae bacterium AB001_6]